MLIDKLHGKLKSSGKSTSSQPFTSSTTSANYTSTKSDTVRTGKKVTQKDNAPTITITPSYVEVYNDESVNNVKIQLRDDRGMVRITSPKYAPIITGLSSTRPILLLEKKELEILQFMIDMAGKLAIKLRVI